MSAAGIHIPRQYHVRPDTNWSTAKADLRMTPRYSRVKIHSEGPEGQFNRVIFRHLLLGTGGGYPHEFSNHGQALILTIDDVDLPRGM